MQRNLRSTSQQKQTKTKKSSSPILNSNKILIVLFLGILLILLIYINNSSWISPAVQTENVKQKPQSNLSQWQSDFEKTLAKHFMSIQWVRNLSQLEKFSDTEAEEFTLRISFPREYSIHKLIYSIIEISEKNNLNLVESYEKISPVSLQIGFACSNGKLLQLNFREKSDLVWHSGKIAVVIDDFGYKMGESVQQFLNLPFPITFAVIPGTQYAKKVAETAKESGFDVLIHLPMEPLNAEVEDNGYTIFTRLSEKELNDVVKKANKLIPNAIGVNNHMGSKATADRRTMARLMRALRKYNLLFLDSVTNRNSVAYTLAAQTGVPALKMTTYLDNPNSDKSIEKKLEEVVKNLKINKTAIVIGHDHKETAQILTKEMTRWAFHGVNFVSLNELLEKP
jgi:uncharacterized protein